jgi:hypothetical protein
MIYISLNLITANSVGPCLCGGFVIVASYLYRKVGFLGKSLLGYFKGGSATAGRRRGSTAKNYIDGVAQFRVFYGIYRTIHPTQIVQKYPDFHKYSATTKPVFMYYNVLFVMSNCIGPYKLAVSQKVWGKGCTHIRHNLYRKFVFSVLDIIITIYTTHHHLMLCATFVNS